jgi:hypothetical protein
MAFGSTFLRLRFDVRGSKLALAPHQAHPPTT